MVPEISLTGTPHQRGETHGEEARDLIAAVLDAWMQSLAPSTDPAAFIAALVNNTGFLNAAEADTPELVEEVRGIAAGANQSFETMFAWQLVDEAWWYLAEQNGDFSPLEKCSALAINHNGSGILAQTQDLDRHFDHAHVMLRTTEPDGMEILSPSIAGLLGLNGVNSAGVAVGITTLSSLAHSRSGVGSGFLTARMLRSRSIDEALSFLRSTPIASGNTFLLGQRDRSVVVEVSADSVLTYADGDRGLHTNHPFVQQPTYDFDLFATSLERFDQLDSTVRPDSTLDELVAMYGTGYICQSRREGEPVVSVATMLFELGDTQRCHYAPGPLDSETLTTYDMTSHNTTGDING